MIRFQVKAATAAFFLATLSSGAFARTAQEDIAELTTGTPQMQSLIKVTLVSNIMGFTIEGMLNKEVGLPATSASKCLYDKFADLNGTVISQIAEDALKGAVIREPRFANAKTPMVLWVELVARYCKPK